MDSGDCSDGVLIQVGAVIDRMWIQVIVAMEC